MQCACRHDKFFSEYGTSVLWLMKILHLVWANSEGSGETARMHRLTWTFDDRILSSNHVYNTSWNKKHNGAKYDSTYITLDAVVIALVLANGTRKGFRHYFEWAHWTQSQLNTLNKLMKVTVFREPNFPYGKGERGGSVVECRTPEREVRGSRRTSAVLCPWARYFTPRKYWLITQEAMAPSRHDWKIVEWDVKPQHNQPTNQPYGKWKEKSLSFQNTM